MPATFQSRTIDVPIDRLPGDVYDLCSVPENLPQWAIGLGASGKRIGPVWMAQTAQGRVAEASNGKERIDGCVDGW